MAQRDGDDAFLDEPVGAVGASGRVAAGLAADDLDRPPATPLRCWFQQAAVASAAPLDRLVVA